MAYTKQTRRIGRGRGRGPSRAVAAGLGPRGGVGEYDRTTSSRISGCSRIARNNSRGTANVLMEDSSYDPTEDTHVEYTPRTPTREDL